MKDRTLRECEEAIERIEQRGWYPFWRLHYYVWERRWMRAPREWEVAR